VGTVPVLVDPDGPNGERFVLAQSGAIAWYACEKSGRFIPADAARRMHALQWFLHALTDVARVSSMVFMSTVLAPEKSEANAAFYKENVVRFFGHANAQLATREYLADELSIADFALYPIYEARKALLEPAEKFGELTRWAATLSARPAVVRGMHAADVPGK